MRSGVIEMPSEHKYDVAIVGGGPAGLSAALILGRSVRKVVVFDFDSTRNAPSKTAHGVFTRDGTSNRKLLEIARCQLAPYDVKIIEKEVKDIQREDKSFKIYSEEGPQVTSRKVIISTGVVDILPDIPGIEKYWGKTVVHCPYCHGWEFRNQPIAVLINRYTALNLASLINGWSDDLVLLSDGPADLEDEVQKKLDSNEISVIQEKITSLTGSDGKLDEIVLQNGKKLKRKALFIQPRQRFHSKLVKQLDLKLKDGRIDTNRFGETSIPGMYAAGDTAPNMQQVAIAAASGTEVGIAINHKLVEEDFNGIS